MTIRVLHVGKFYPPYKGGIETHLEVLCGELKGHVDLDVLVSNTARGAVDEVLDGVRVARAGTLFSVSSAPISPAMVARIRRARADIVHIHLPNPTAILAYLAAGSPGALVLSYHSDIVRQRVGGTVVLPFVHAAMRRASAVVAATPNYVTSSPVLARYQSRCHVIPYGIDVDRYSRKDEPAEAAIRERFGPRIVLSVGRLIYYKGFEYLVRAMADVDARLLIVGVGPLRASLERIAGEAGVADRVVFLGAVDDEDLASYYRAADVFVLASVARSEAFGIVQLEAMAAGVPVVNTRLDSGVPYVSLDGLTGLTVEPESPADLARAVRLLLDEPERRSRYGEAARARAKAEFSKEIMVERMLGLYDRVLAARPS
jgi:rhamnosyl/mannosyltransferase